MSTKTIVEDTPITKPFVRPDIEVVKPTIWENGELRPNRLAGRPKRDFTKPERKYKSQIGTYQKVARREDKILENMDYFLNHKNDKIRLDATMYLFDKILPNKRALELENKHAPITVNLLNAGFIPPNADVAPSMGSDERPTPIQSISVAPKGKEDDNGHHRSSKTGDNEKGSVLAPVPNVR